MKTQRDGSDAAGVDVRRLVSRLRFRHLELLQVLHEGGSLRAAAQVLNLTQPALSKTLREVESAFGFALFVRGARGLTPTPRGELAIRGAGLLLQELAHLHAEVGAEPAVTVLRVGAPPFVAQGYMPKILAGLFDLHAKVKVQLAEERVPVLVQALLAGELDALVSSYPAEMPETLGRPLVYEKLFETTFTVIAPAGHALARASRTDWQRLGDAPWIMPARNAMVRRLIDDAFRREGVPAPAPVIESSSPFTNMRMVAAGLGLSAVPEWSLRDSPVAARVARVRIRPAIHPGPVALIYRGAPENPRVELLRSALRGALPFS